MGAYGTTEEKEGVINSIRRQIDLWELRRTTNRVARKLKNLEKQREEKRKHREEQFFQKEVSRKVKTALAAIPKLVKSAAKKGKGVVCLMWNRYDCEAGKIMPNPHDEAVRVISKYCKKLGFETRIEKKEICTGNPMDPNWGWDEYLVINW